MAGRIGQLGKRPAYGRPATAAARSATTITTSTNKIKTSPPHPTHVQDSQINFARSAEKILRFYFARSAEKIWRFYFARSAEEISRFYFSWLGQFLFYIRLAWAKISFIYG